MRRASNQSRAWVRQSRVGGVRLGLRLHEEARRVKAGKGRQVLRLREGVRRIRVRVELPKCLEPRPREDKVTVQETVMTDS